MTDKPPTNPDAPVEKPPFPLPTDIPQLPSPFATKPDTQVLTKQADAKANESSVGKVYVVKYELTTGTEKTNVMVPGTIVDAGDVQIGMYLDTTGRNLYRDRFVAVLTFYYANGPIPKPPVTIDLVLKLLLDLPDDIFDYQKIYDSVLIQYETRLSDLSYKALSIPMFPGKKDEPLRAASNDKEREIAISQTLIADEKMKILTNELNEAKNELTLAKNKLEAAKIAATLLAVK